MESYFLTISGLALMRAPWSNGAQNSWLHELPKPRLCFTLHVDTRILECNETVNDWKGTDVHNLQEDFENIVGTMRHE